MQPRRAKLTAEEYLALELTGSVKHEYVDGEIYAMVGASRRHNLLTTNLIRHTAEAAARRGGCHVFGPDMKVYVEAHNSYYYPDVSGSCEPGDDDARVLTRPCFIIEVLSPSTATIDRREKRKSYQTLPSLQDYLVVHQERMQIYAYRREFDEWTMRVLEEPRDAVSLSCLELELTLEQIYQGVGLPPPLEIRDAAMLDSYTLSVWAQGVRTDPAIMEGRPCIRGTRVTVGSVLGMLAAGCYTEEIREAHPELQPEDIRAALAYAALRSAVRYAPEGKRERYGPESQP